MTRSITDILVGSITGEKILQTFWEKIHFLSLLGMNIGSGDDFAESGELWLLNHIRQKYGRDERIVLFDVGANIGKYALHANTIYAGTADIFCFEPSMATFDRLNHSIAGKRSIQSFNYGLGEIDGEAILYTDAEASGHASVFKRHLDHVGVFLAKTERVHIQTIDQFCKEHTIERIHFLKIDVEGNELAVLLGAKKMLRAGMIDHIQFKFGGTHIDARVFLKDFYNLLSPRYNRFRLLKDGLAPLPRYKEKYEIFTTTNFFAPSDSHDRPPCELLTLLSILETIFSTRCSTDLRRVSFSRRQSVVN